MTVLYEKFDDSMAAIKHAVSAIIRRDPVDNTGIRTLEADLKALSIRIHALLSDIKTAHGELPEESPLLTALRHCERSLSPYHQNALGGACELDNLSLEDFRKTHLPDAEDLPNQHATLATIETALKLAKIALDDLLVEHPALTPRTLLKKPAPSAAKPLAKRSKGEKPKLVIKRPVDLLPDDLLTEKKLLSPGTTTTESDTGSVSICSPRSSDSRSTLSGADITPHLDASADELLDARNEVRYLEALQRQLSNAGMQSLLNQRKIVMQAEAVTTLLTHLKKQTGEQLVAVKCGTRFFSRPKFPLLHLPTVPRLTLFSSRKKTPAADIPLAKEVPAYITDLQNQAATEQVKDADKLNTGLFIAYRADATPANKVTPVQRRFTVMS